MAKKQTTALTDTELQAFGDHIDKMHRKHRLIEQSPFTHEDALQLFVEAEDRAAVMAAARLYGVHQLPSGTYVNVNSQLVDRRSVQYFVKIGSGRDWGFPDRPDEKFAKSAPDELVQRFTEYCEQKVKTALEYGLVQHNLRVLNAVCSAPSQMAFLWPSITVMAKDMGPKYEALFGKKPKTIPGVSPELRQMCQTTATTVMMNQMLSDPPAPNELVYVTFYSSGDVMATAPLGTYCAI